MGFSTPSASVLGVTNNYSKSYVGQITSADDPLPDTIGWYIVSSGVVNTWKGLSKWSSFALISKGDTPIYIAINFADKALYYYDATSATFKRLSTV